MKFTIQLPIHLEPPVHHAHVALLVHFANAVGGLSGTSICCLDRDDMVRFLVLSIDD
jgi:hypothetical protein